MTNIFSWYCTENCPRLVLRPWWAFWRRDTLVFEDKRVRRMVSLTGIEALHVSAAFKDDFALLKKFMGRDVDTIQLESGVYATPYVPTNSISPLGKQLIERSKP